MYGTCKLALLTSISRVSSSNNAKLQELVQITIEGIWLSKLRT